MTKRFVILNAKRERIRNTLKGGTDCHTPCGARNDRATAYCTHHTVFVATKRLVILSAKHERIRLPFKRKTDCRTPCGGLGGGAFNILKKTRQASYGACRVFFALQGLTFFRQLVIPRCLFKGHRNNIAAALSVLRGGNARCSVKNSAEIQSVVISHGKGYFVYIVT